jgi:DNA end-binding protein Ku
MARPMWKGSISFGLVNIPVGLSLAVRSKDVRFHQLHDEDGGRIKEKRFCEKDGKEVPYEHVVKGFEISKNRYVTVTREELQTVDPVADKTISIEEFVKLEEIDPVFFDRSYFVAPDGKGAGKPYALLANALEHTGHVGLARIVFSTSQHLCHIRSHGGQLMLTTMAYADEVAEAPETPKTDIAPKELQMAETLIDQMVGKFDPQKYKDERRERVLALLKRKADGKEIAAPPEAAPERVTSLIDALERSLAAGKEKPPGRANSHPRARSRHSGGRRAAQGR